MSTAEGFAAHREWEWERELADAGLAVISWPQRYGGRDASLTQWLVFKEEHYRADGPVRVGQNGLFLLAPTLLRHGTDEQRDLACLAISAEQVGAAARALELTVNYTKTRIQFGRPIASFQAIQHRLAELHALAESAPRAVVTGRPGWQLRLGPTSRHAPPNCRCSWLRLSPTVQRCSPKWRPDPGPNDYIQSACLGQASIVSTTSGGPSVAWTADVPYRPR